MDYDLDDDIISTDMYIKQQNYYDITTADDVQCYVVDYNAPQIQDTGYSNYGPWSDNAHLVFDVPRLPEREW